MADWEDRKMAALTKKRKPVAEPTRQMDFYVAGAIFFAILVFSGLVNMWMYCDKTPCTGTDRWLKFFSPFLVVLTLAPWFIFWMMGTRNELTPLISGGLIVWFVVGITLSILHYNYFR